MDNHVFGKTAQVCDFQEDNFIASTKWQHGVDSNQLIFQVLYNKSINYCLQSSWNDGSAIYCTLGYVGQGECAVCMEFII